MRALPAVILLAGCGLFGGGSGGSGRGGRQSRGAETTPTMRSHLEVTLLNRCAHPVEVCYGPETCLTLSGSAPRVVHAETTGNSQIFVSLKDSASGVFADVTFAMIVIDASCAHLDRQIKPR